MIKKVIFIESVHEVLQQRLEAMGYSCDLRYEIGRDELREVIHEYVGLVVRSRITLDRVLLEKAENLRFIARSGSGLENIDVSYARSGGIEVFSSPEGNRDAVGEHVIGMILMLFNKLNKADLEVRSHLWHREENRGIELNGKTIGIIGYGVMGRGLAEKLAGFGCRILAHDKYKTGFTNACVQECPLETIHREADIVSLHLPLTQETIHYVNDEFVNRFHKPFYLVNTARGKNVQTSAVMCGIKDGRILGACLDVLEYEKASLEGLDFEHLPEDLKYLVSSDKVVLTPHIAGWTRESYYKLSAVLADKIETWMRSK